MTGIAYTQMKEVVEQNCDFWRLRKGAQQKALGDPTILVGDFPSKQKI